MNISQMKRILSTFLSIEPTAHPSTLSSTGASNLFICLIIKLRLTLLPHAICTRLFQCILTKMLENNPPLLCRLSLRWNFRPSGNLTSVNGHRHHFKKKQQQQQKGLWYSPCQLSLNLRRSRVLFKMVL